MAEESIAELPRIRDNDFSLIYANWIQGSRSPWDITLTMGDVREIEPNRIAVLEKVAVVLTPQMAKALIGTLAATVKEYEMDNGEIPIPASLRRLSEDRAAKRGSASPSASPSVSPSASTSPSASASPSPENEEED